MKQQIKDIAGSNYSVFGPREGKYILALRIPQSDGRITASVVDIQDGKSIKYAVDDAIESIRKYRIDNGLAI